MIVLDFFLSMKVEAKEEHPRISIKCTMDDKKNRYVLFHEEDPVGTFLSEDQFNTVSCFDEKTPNHLVYTSKLAMALMTYNDINTVSGDQFVAEVMYELSQEGLLGNLIKAEMYGPHIVGYRLAAAVKVDYEREFTSAAGEKKTRGLLGRLNFLRH